jgi:hypothetical protein
MPPRIDPNNPTPTTNTTYLPATRTSVGTTGVTRPPGGAGGEKEYSPLEAVSLVGSVKNLLEAAVDTL